MHGEQYNTNILNILDESLNITNNKIQTKLQNRIQAMIKDSVTVDRMSVISTRLTPMSHIKETICRDGIQTKPS